MDQIKSRQGITNPPAGTYQIDPDRSTVAFRTRHMFGLAAVRGRFAVASGEIVVAEAPEDSTVSAVVDLAAFHTGNAMRDRTVRSGAYLDVARQPTAGYVSTGLERVADQAWRVHGGLTIHGLTVPTVLDVDVPTWDGTQLHLRAHTTVDRYAFGITRGKGITGRYLEMEFNVVAAVESSAIG
jgi:polyisoprenoid-binding protein YceI